METRTSKCTDGKERTFSYDGVYYTPEHSTKEELERLFNDFEKLKACVLYTTIKHDKGNRVFTDIPSIEEYDNGLVGYQNASFFNDIVEAKKEYETIKRLSAKEGIIGYCDVFLFYR